jgi:hypothetical protein
LARCKVLSYTIVADANLLSQFICPVREHTCFDGVDLPLLGVSKLLEQPIPDDFTTTTDFDLYQYIMYRPATKYAEFGGLIWYVATSFYIRRF